MEKLFKNRRYKTVIIMYEVQTKLLEFVFNFVELGIVRFQQLPPRG